MRPITTEVRSALALWCMKKISSATLTRASAMAMATESAGTNSLRSSSGERTARSTINA